MMSVGWFDHRKYDPKTKKLPNLWRETGIEIPWEVQPTFRGMKQGLVDEDKYAKHTFPKVVANYKPDIVWSVGDCWMWYPYVKPNDFRKCYTFISYVPIDGAPMPNDLKRIMVARHPLATEEGITHQITEDINWPQTMREVDTLVSYGKWGQKVINDRCGEEVCKDYIHHGVDSTTFHPLSKEEREAERKKRFGLEPDDFLIGWVGRNQPRKPLERTLLALRKCLANGWLPRRTFLLYHAPLIDVGWSVMDMIQDFGLAGHIIVDKKLRVGRGPTDKELNILYNCMDVFTLPTRGEGWGLPILEAMSCGVPVLVSDYSAPPEFCSEAGELIKISELDAEPITNIRRAIVSTDSYASKLKKLYRNPALRKEYGHKGRKKAEELDWKNICVQWEKLFDRVRLPMTPYDTIFNKKETGEATLEIL